MQLRRIGLALFLGLLALLLVPVIGTGTSQVAPAGLSEGETYELTPIRIEQPVQEGCADKVLIRTLRATSTSIIDNVDPLLLRGLSFGSAGGEPA